MAKLGEGRLGEMIDRGGRELGGFLYPDSNIAQPMYPRHRAYEASKEANEQGMSLGDRLKQTENQPRRITEWMNRIRALTERFDRKPSARSRAAWCKKKSRDDLNICREIEYESQADNARDFGRARPFGMAADSDATRGGQPLAVEGVHFVSPFV